MIIFQTDNDLQYTTKMVSLLEKVDYYTHKVGNKNLIKHTIKRNTQFCYLFGTQRQWSMNWSEFNKGTVYIFASSIKDWSFGRISH